MLLARMLRDRIEDFEIAAIVCAHLHDRHATDTQQFLLDGDDATRTELFDELNRVSAHHQLSFKNVFSKGGDAADAVGQIAELHFDVNDISKEVTSDV